PEQVVPALAVLEAEQALAVLGPAVGGLVGLAGRRGDGPGDKQGKRGDGRRGADASASPAPSEAGATTYPADADETAPTAAEPDDNGLPAWVPLVFVVLLLGAVALTLLRRRGATGRP
ncbi:hypothetical protein, partial [Nocardioides marmotae]|uniref:hypothetical protein n=1 Tax=Nocardioides marmotae TaxID=2663857 RepID=UPI0019AFF1D3